MWGCILFGSWRSFLHGTQVRLMLRFLQSVGYGRRIVGVVAPLMFVPAFVSGYRSGSIAGFYSPSMKYELKKNCRQRRRANVQASV